MSVALMQYMTMRTLGRRLDDERSGLHTYLVWTARHPVSFPIALCSGMQQLLLIGYPKWVMDLWHFSSMPISSSVCDGIYVALHFKMAATYA